MGSARKVAPRLLLLRWKLHIEMETTYYIYYMERKKERNVDHTGQSTVIIRNNKGICINIQIGESVGVSL